MSANGVSREQRVYGNLYLPCIANVQPDYTDFWSFYEQAFPSLRHRAVGKKSGKTNLIERFNCTLRQRVSRLVRETLSFSKKLSNHIGAIWYFIHHYNELCAYLRLLSTFYPYLFRTTQFAQLVQDRNYSVIYIQI
jgi:IS1 family transposase